MKKIYLCITLLSTTFFFGQANYLVDNFDYTAASLLSANGWIVHSGTTNSIAVSSPGLTYAGYIGSGVGNAAAVTNTGIDVNRPLAGNISDGSVYASFLFKPSGAITSTSTSNYFFHFLKYSNETTPVTTSVNSAFRARTFILPGTNAATQFKIGLTFNASDYITPSNVTADLDITKTYLIVVKYTFVDGLLNDIVNLYLFPEGANINTEPTTPTLGPITATVTTVDPFPLADDLNIIQGVALRQNSGGQNAIVDGIYVRKEWNLTSPGTPLSVNAFAEKNTLKVYPNPVNNNRVSIYSEVDGQKEVTLTDMTGRTILKKTMTNNELDLTNVNKGIYLLETKIGESSTTTKLIVN